jgi:hypothetical protein
MLTFQYSKLLLPLMKISENLQNSLLLVSILLILGLGCASEDADNRRPTPRSTPEARNRNENRDNTNRANENMTNKSENTPVNVDRTSFHSVLEYTLAKRNLKKSDICDESNPVQKRILNEYGAFFLTASATPPPTCMFKSEDEVTAFQNRIDMAREKIAGADIELQANAMDALLKAREEAKSQGLDITPRDGSEAGRRAFDDTLRLWKSRFDPACEYWKKKGRLTDDQINRLKSLPVNDQVKEVLELEEQGIYFNTFFNATILSSVAAPGTSQHLSMLAFDANEFKNERVREILGKHGWFRTVKGDAPHFTFLGVKEEDLINMGLQRIETNDGEFWVPNV